MTNQLLEAMRLFVVYALPVTVAIATLTLFILALGRMKQLEAKLAGAEEGLRTETAALHRSLCNLQKEVAAKPDEVVPASVAVANGSSTIRAKALKMHRLGQSVPQIAQALRLSKGDVTLLLKVHDIVLQTFEPEQKN